MIHTSTALVVVDQEPFLKKALSRCKRLRNELNKKQKLLSQYEDSDRVAFHQWLSRTFGAKLSKVRELTETLHQYDFIVYQLEHCSFFCRDKLPEVHKELFERKKDGTLFQFVLPMDKKPSDADEDDDDNDEWEDEEEEWEDDDEWEMEDSFEEFFRSKGGHSDSEESHYFDPGNPHARKSINATNHIRLKKCYRSLAKRLHPDHSTLDESIREKRWHEIQDAYQSNDLEALLRVEAICDMDGADLSISLGLARLTDLAHYHQSHLQPIRHELSRAKQDIAFGFTQSGPTAKIHNEMKFELNYKSRNLESEIAEMQKIADFILSAFLAQQKRHQQSRHKSVSNKKTKNRQFTEDPQQMNLF